MKCVSIVYKRPNTQGHAPQFMPIRSVKRSVDEYIEKLKQKQQNNKYMTKPLNMNFRAKINTAQTSRQHKLMKSEDMTDSMNVFKLKYSTENIFKQENFSQGQNKKQRKFRSTFVKKKEPNGFYSLKGIKLSNNQLFEHNNLTASPIKNQNKTRNTSKLLCLRRLKLIKPKTILLSIDFILNQHSFWQQQKIDESAHKNWKILQEHSNIVWMTRRQNSLKKLEKYAAEYGLRLDGVYKIMQNKKTLTLILSLASFEKDFFLQLECTKKEDTQREIIVIHSLKVQLIQDVRFQQFYNSLPVSKCLRCIVHFIQIDMSDKARFNSPLKVLSKQKLPHPNSLNHFFSAFNKTHSANPIQCAQLYHQDLGNVADEVDSLTNQEMMQKYEETKETFVNYFGNHLKINLNKKVKIESGQASVQYVIGDMLRRNFNIMCNYHKQSRKIHEKLEKMKEKLKNNLVNTTNENSQNFLENNFLKPQLKITLNQILNSKLIQTKKIQTSRKTFTQSNEDQKYYMSPVFLWKK